MGVKIYRILWRTKRLFWRSLLPLGRDISIPTSCLDSCDWPNCLKLFYVINRKRSFLSLHSTAIPGHFLWGWKQFVPLERLNSVWCENRKEDHYLINICRGSEETYIVTVFISVSFGIVLKCLYVMTVNVTTCNSTRHIQWEDYTQNVSDYHNKEIVLTL